MVVTEADGHYRLRHLQQFGSLTRPLRRQPRQYALQILVQIMRIELGRLDLISAAVHLPLRNDPAKSLFLR